MVQHVNTIIVGSPSLLREGVVYTLSRTRFNTDATAECASAVTAEAWGRHRPPSLTIMITADLPQPEAVHAVRSLRERDPSQCIVVLCENAEIDSDGVFRAGATACLPAGISPDILVMSLNLLMAKEVALAVEAERASALAVAAAIGGSIPGSGTTHRAANGLTRREIDVLEAVVLGDSNKRIANRLSMREPTVKSHMRVILKKIRANNRTQAATWAVAHGLADLQSTRPLASSPRSERHPDEGATP